MTEPRYLRLMLSTLSHLRLSARLSPAVISLVIFVCAGNAEDFVDPPFFVVLEQYFIVIQLLLNVL